MTAGLVATRRWDAERTEEEDAEEEAEVQGLTLVHFAAQPEPCLTHTKHPTHPKHPLTPH